jgi:hypothetical protein
MSINVENDNNIPINTDAYYEYYEELASQEELYLEETEEQVVAILTSYVSPASQNYSSTVIENCVLRESDEQLVEASEELITGDADDPPLSEEAVHEMLNDVTSQRLRSTN